MKTEIFAACDQLLTAAFNGSCQGIFLALLAGLGLRLLGRTNAATRHAAWFVTLLLLALLIPAHYWRHRLVASGPLTSRQVGISTARDVPERQTLPESKRRRAPLATALQSALPETARHTLSTAVAPRIDWGQPEPAFEHSQTAGLVDRLTTILPLPAGEGRGEGKSDPVSWTLAVSPKIPRSASLLLLAAWLAVAGIKLAFLLRGLYQLRKLKDNSTQASPGLEHLFQHLRSELAVNRTVKLKVSQSHRSALLLGFVHPVIVLPAEAAQESGLGQAEHILRHELAHARRRDDWTNLAQRLIQAALFFHPAVWWISKQLSLEREIACDDSVLHQGIRPQPYALLLANLASRMTGPLPIVAPGASSSKSQLQQRITMILNTHRNTSPRLARARLGFITSAAALIAVLAVYSAPRLVLAQDQTPAPAPATPAPGTTAPPAALPQAPLAPLPPGGSTLVRPPTPSSDMTSPAPVVNNPSDAVAPPRPPHGTSIEERLERLERMVQTLLAQQDLKRPRPDLENLAPEAKNQPFNPREMELLKDSIRHEVAVATDQARRAAEQAKRAAQQAAGMWHLRAEQNTPDNDLARNSFDQRLAALQSQREALAREMQKLDREIQRLQRDRGRNAEDPQPRSQNDADQPKPDPFSSETPAKK